MEKAEEAGFVTSVMATESGMGELPGEMKGGNPGPGGCLTAIAFGPDM